MYHFELRIQPKTTTAEANAATGGFCITFNYELNKKRPLEEPGRQRRILYHFELRIEQERPGRRGRLKKKGPQEGGRRQGRILYERVLY